MQGQSSDVIHLNNIIMTQLGGQHHKFFSFFTKSPERICIIVQSSGFMALPYHHPLQISVSSSRPSESAAILDAADDRNRKPASLALFLTEASCWDFLQ